MPKGQSGKYSPKQKKLAATAPPRNVLDGKDFAKLRGKNGTKKKKKGSKPVSRKR